MIVNKASRRSKNIIDKRPKKGDLFHATDVKSDHLRQIYQPDVSKSITKLANRVVRADPDRAHGTGMTKMRSPAKKVMYNKFSKKGK